jgi:hypothetical protein
MLKALERRKVDWLPEEVEDLAGKVKDFGSEALLTRYTTVWRCVLPYRIEHTCLYTLSSQFDWKEQTQFPTINLQMDVYRYVTPGR